MMESILGNWEERKSKSLSEMRRLLEEVCDLAILHQTKYGNLPELTARARVEGRTISVSAGLEEESPQTAYWKGLAEKRECLLQELQKELKEVRAHRDHLDSEMAKVCHVLTGFDTYRAYDMISVALDVRQEQRRLDWIEANSHAQGEETVIRVATSSRRSLREAVDLHVGYELRFRVDAARPIGGGDV